MKNDELKAYKGDIYIPVYGSIADAKVYLKDKVDEAIAELKQKLEERKNAAIDIKLSAEKVLRDLLDCGMIQEWFFNGEFHAVLKSDDPHLQIAELKAENERLKKEVWEADERAIDAGATSVEKMAELRATRRALWLARAERADDRARIFFFCDLETVLDIDGFSHDYKKKKGHKKLTAKTWRIIWLKVERKCREKAEEYKEAK